MHELAVTESILSIAIKHATAAGASRVTDIYITIGQLSSIVDDSVQFYWDTISEGTICTGATLHFERIPAKLLCQQCGKEFGINLGLEPCTQCGSFNVKIISGEEFWVESLEIEKIEVGDHEP